MPDVSNRRLAAKLLAGIPALLLLGACSTTVTGAARLANADPQAWAAEEQTLPVELHGTVKGKSERQLAALLPHAPRADYASLASVAVPPPAHHVVLFVNAATLPPERELCAGSEGFAPARQDGPRASVTAVLCDGATVVARADGMVRADHETDASLRAGLTMMEDELIYTLYPVTQDYYG